MDGAEESAESEYGRCDVGRVQDSKSYDYLTLFQYPWKSLYFYNCGFRIYARAETRI